MLESIGLNSFQHHIILKLFNTILKIYNIRNSPQLIKESLFNKFETQPYYLRSNAVFVQLPTNFLHYGEVTFNNFFTKLVSLV